MGDDYLATTTDATWQAPTLAEMKAIIDKFDAARQREVVRWGEIFEQSKCGVCGRKPFLFKSGGRDTIGCCEHTYAAIRLVTREAIEPHTGQIPAWAIGIEVVR